MNTDNPHCWICLEEGPNEEREPLLNDCCACRGSAGYVHSTCLIDYAKAKTREAVKSRRTELKEIWLECPNCNSNWTQTRNMSSLMGEACSTFVADEFSDDHELRMKALETKLDGMDFFNIEIKRVAMELLLKINAWYGGNSQHKPRNIRITEIRVYMKLGSIALLQKQNPRHAMKKLIHCKTLMKEMGFAEDCHDMMLVDINIARAEGMLSGGRNITSAGEELTRKHYEEVKKNGKSLDMICSLGRNRARILIDLDKFDEAKEILLDLLPRSQQVYGETHPTTKGIKQLLRECFTGIVQQLRK